MIDINKTLRSQLQESNSNYMLGVLSTDPLTFPNIGTERNESVTFTKTGYNICFFVNPISAQPTPINELDSILQENGILSTVYIGFEESFPRNLLPLDSTYNSDYQNKLQKIKEILTGKIIVFRPKITINNEGKIFKNIDIVSLEDANITQNMDYLPVPLIKEKEKFELALTNSELLLLQDYYHTMLPPVHALSENQLYYFEGEWKKVPGKKNGWLYTSSKTAQIININAPELRSHQVVASPNNLVFIESDYILGLQERFQKEGIDISKEDYSQGDVNNNLIINKVLDEKHKTDDQNFSKDSYSSNSDAQKLEQQFLNDLQKNALSKKLFYKKEDLINFHISVKTNPITILSGMSGTGKSQLALLYAKTLGLSKEEGTLLMLPISPSYTEPEDLIGFHNSSTGLYMPSETGLVDFLIHAKNETNKMHMVIFDEMNLSQVEYWFAPFISLLEIDESVNYRELKLWSKDTVCHNASKYPPSINIGNNIIFIGTANMDETTKDFSDRLLDRANIVTPQKMKFISLQKTLDDNEENFEVKEEYIELYRTKYRSWNFSKDAWSAFNENELEFFDKLHDIIQKYDRQKGVSFRALERIGMYLNNIPKDELGNFTIQRSDAIDLQIKQRILTKIRGSFEKINDLIGTMTSQESTPQNSELYDYFVLEESQTISHFNLTIEEIKRKSRELSVNDYTS